MEDVSRVEKKKFEGFVGFTDDELGRPLRFHTSV
jgi:hypothetical protein